MEKDKLMVKEFYTLEQLSKELNITIPTLRNLVKDGLLKASKVGNRYIVKRENIIKLLDDNLVN